MSAPLSHLAVGRIVKAHGLEGEVAVEPEAPTPGRFAPGVTLWLEGAPDGAAGRPVRIETSRVHQGRPLVRFEGVADRSGAEALAGRWLLVAYDEAAAARADDEYFLHTLIGREVRTEDGEALGTVLDVVEAENAALLEIGAAAGPRRLLPFVKEFVSEVTDDAIVVAPPAGWENL